MRFAVACLLLTIALVSGQNQDDLVNSNVERALDLVSHLPKETISVTIENKGSKGVRHYDFLVEPAHVNDVAYVGASVRSSVRSFLHAFIRSFRSKERTAMIREIFP